MFTLDELIKITNGSASAARGDLKICGISTDSRSIRPGELFIALKGDKFNGTSFLASAKDRGAVAAIVPYNTLPLKGIDLIYVISTRHALSSIAMAYRQRFDIPVIAVTGSNGKTTTKDMIAHILSDNFKVLKTNENENNEIGIAQTLLKLRDENIAVIELGTNSFGEIESRCKVTKPNVALITNIGYSHLQGLRDKAGVCKEKAALVESLGGNGVWIKNYDDELISCLDRDGVKILSYGIINKDVNFSAENIKKESFLLKVFNLPDSVSRAFYNIKFQLLGIHNVYNALAAISTCSLFMKLDEIADRLASFNPPHMRMEILKINNFTVLNDCYNSNPLSFKFALNSLRDYNSKGRKVVVAADMLELGEGSEKLHYESGRFLAQQGLDFLFTYGERAIDIARGAADSGMDKEKVRSFNSKIDMVNFLRKFINNDDVILVKGSRGMRMEEVVELLSYSVIAL